MRGQKKNLKSLCIGKDWTLFLDRDGVINKKIEGDYVRSWSQFEFIDGAIEGLKILRKIFGRIIVVTNQRGIGLGLMTENDLHKIHENMQKILQENGVFIDKIYYCPHDYQKENCDCRKPKVGLALKAKKRTSDPFIAWRNCVVLPSYREGVPRVLLEAMAMEKPIITTDAPGCKNVCVDGVNGFLVKPKDVESLYLAMKKMVELGDEKLREFGKAGRRLAEEKYSVEKIVGEYINLIEAILSKS
jgi:D-glycero-D-manno-heptose 1,7-bisphosphate phosphatase